MTLAIPASAEPALAFPATQLKAIRWNVYLATVALGIGGIFGLYQALERLGLDFLYRAMPPINNYYQGLTIHGVMLVLVFTFAFSNGFLLLATMRSLERPIRSTALAWAAFWSMALGVALAGWAMFANEATVMFTFYPPLKAHWALYLGLVLVVLSTWLTSANQILTVWDWQREHPGERIPLMAFTSLLAYVLWDFSSLGVALEVVLLLLPWSIGLVETVDPQLARTLFWFSGHPIVYIWLLPVYVSWYTMIPKQVGGRIFSDPLVRFVFLMFLLYSTPVGVHHQFTESAISPVMKAIMAVNTFVVFFPSMVTAFSVMASLEGAGRSRGGGGLLGWIPKLPWGDPSVTAQLLSMLVFMLGGLSGLINASYTMNLVVHNTSFVPGHFHLTVGTAVALSIIGIFYWLVPYLTGKALWGRRMAVAQAWLWTIGVLIFSRGQISAGLHAMPRRTAIGVAPYLDQVPSWGVENLMTAVGGIMMVISGLLFFVVMILTIGGAEGEAKVEIPVAEAEEREEPRVWPALDYWGRWLVVAVLLTLAVYGPVFVGYLPISPTSPGFRVW
jgi:cytochrome c oxidase subunit 1